MCAGVAVACREQFSNAGLPSSLHAWSGTRQPPRARLAYTLERRGGKPTDLKVGDVPGVELAEVSMLLGHSELRVTMDFYAHLQQQTAAKAARQMDAILG